MTAKIDPSYTAKVAAFDGSGKARKEVAALVGISKKSLQNIIKANGFDIGKPRVAPKPRPPLGARNVAPRQPTYGLVTVTKFALTGHTEPRPIYVTLPQPPLGIVFTSDRSETEPPRRAPRDPKATWQRDRVLASAARVAA